MHKTKIYIYVCSGHNYIYIYVMNIHLLTVLLYIHIRHCVPTDGTAYVVCNVLRYHEPWWSRLGRMNLSFAFLGILIHTITFVFSLCVDRFGISGLIRTDSMLLIVIVTWQFWLLFGSLFFCGTNVCCTLTFC